MNDFPGLDASALERYGRLLLFRPSLHIVYKGPRILEEVNVWYSSRTYSFDECSTASGMTVAPSAGRAKYIRAWVYNFFGFSAHHCQVFVDYIWHNGKLIESERSPLH